jgi:hypothetical protein
MLEIAKETLEIVETEKNTGRFTLYSFMRNKKVLLDNVKCIIFKCIHIEIIIYLYDNGFLTINEFDMNEVKKDFIQYINSNTIFPYNNYYYYQLPYSKRQIIDTFLTRIFCKLFDNNETVINITDNKIFYIGDFNFVENIKFLTYPIHKFKYFYLIFRNEYIAMLNNGKFDSPPNEFFANEVLSVVDDIRSQMRGKFRTERLKELLS